MAVVPNRDEQHGLSAQRCRPHPKIQDFRHKKRYVTALALYSSKHELEMRY
jgi:hypothetical protein